MTEIEHERPGGECLQNPLGFLDHSRSAGDEKLWIEVALQSDPWRRLRARPGQWDHAVDLNRIDFAFGRVARYQSPTAVGKADDRNFGMNRFAGLRPYTPPADVFDIFKREFDAAYKEGGLFQLTMHPHIIGYRSRIWILEELVRYMRSLPGVWFATHADVVRYAKKHG